MTTIEDLHAGQVIDGRYELLDLLGRGGMGCVYRAEHLGIRKHVALKLFAPAGGESGSVERARFEREAFATGQLRHPNCVAITDFGKLDDGILYLVMELLEGRSLADVLDAEDVLAPARALHIARHVLEGVAHAHDHGIVHRDLKPANVILVEHLGDPDFAKVLDFGLAKLQGATLEAEGGQQLTVAGVTFGTPHYMSPEQVFGKPVDHRSDLYAVSVLLFEMLSGVRPFDAPDIRGVLLAHGARAVPRIHEVGVGATVPLEVEMLVREGLAKDPRDRIQDARAYVSRIDECLRAMGHVPPSRVATVPPVVAPEVPPPRFDLGTSATVPLPSAVDASMILAETPAPRPGKRRVAVWVAGAMAVMGVLAAAAVPSSAPADGNSAAKVVEAPGAESVPEPDPGDDPQRDDDAGDAVHDSAALDAAIARAIAAPNRRAVQQLTALKKQHPESAEVQFSLGQLYYARPWPSEAIKAYRRALELDPAYRSNATIIDHAISLLSSRSSRWAAKRLLVRDIGDAALPALDAAARQHPRKTIRDRAADAARAIRAQ